MAKRNSSRRSRPGSSAGRSGSRENSSRNKKDSESKPFKKSKPGNTSRYKKENDSEDNNRSPRIPRFSSAGKGGSSRSESAPFKKARPGNGDRYKKEDGNENTKRPMGGTGRNQGPIRESGSSSRPRFNKRKDEDSSEGNHKPRFSSARKDEGSRSGSAPFKKARPGNGDRYKKEDGNENTKRPMRGGDRKGRGSDDKSTPFEKRGFFDQHKSGTRTNRTEKSEESFENTPVQTQQIRLNRYIANSGVCSRREADELITMGLISVNGKAITELGFKVNPGDEVRYESRVLRAEKPVYILLNKPKGYLTTTSDPQERKTVMHLLGNTVRERIYPVGRLDRNTTGLLLLTNDGELADKLMHPSHNVKKIYKAELDRALTKADFQRIMEGVQLEEGRAIVDDLAIISDDGKTVGLELHIGWNRVVRRIFEALEYEVLKLDRSVYAGLDKKELSRGQWRFLRKEEIVRLKHYK